MRTILSDKVERKLEDYALHLVPLVSPERLIVKVERLRTFLYGIGDMMVHRTCMNESLGQRFDRQGKPIVTNLKRVNYKDESNFQWAIVYMVHEASDTAYIYDMIPALAVK